MPRLPKDCSSRVIGSTARQLVHASINTVNWEFHEITGTDHGIDCVLELIDDEQWTNCKIEGQIKGTRNPVRIACGDFSFDMSVKTINYGLSSNNAFVLFYVDVDNDKVYYLSLQDYFIENKNLFDRLEKNKTTLTLHIPKENIVNKNTIELIQLAKTTYINGPSRELQRYINERS